MDLFKDGWFTEISPEEDPDWDWQPFSLEVDVVLYHEKSDFQDILVFKSKSYGTVLILDGVIQCTERDEFSYQEMISFLPLNCHPSPKKVLIIGGGDGGVVREVSKHPLVESIVLCEIDPKVIEVSKKYLPFMAEGFDSPKLTLHVGDGFEYMGKNSNKFDVIITDSSDPIGPARSLFEKPYYELTNGALRDGGIVCAQGECMWIDLETTIKKVYKFCKEVFPQVAYASTTVPTYTTGQIGFILCSKNPNIDFRKPLHVFSDKDLDSMKIRYYNTALHSAAFCLPRFVNKTLENT